MPAKRRTVWGVVAPTNWLAASDQSGTGDQSRRTSANVLLAGFNAGRDLKTGGVKSDGRMLTIAGDVDTMAAAGDGSPRRSRPLLVVRGPGK